MKQIFSVTGMACKHCAAKVEAKASSLTGVKHAEVELEGGLLTVEYDETLLTSDAIAAAVTAIGFPVKEA